MHSCYAIGEIWGLEHFRSSSSKAFFQCCFSIYTKTCEFRVLTDLYNLEIYQMISTECFIRDLFKLQKIDRDTKTCAQLVCLVFSIKFIIYQKKKKDREYKILMV